ncbi:PepSY domain-containing protein, partial [Klebsiella variicola]
MKQLFTTLALALAAGTALAHGAVSCPALPKEEKQPQMALQKKLEGEGWKV